MTDKQRNNQRNNEMTHRAAVQMTNADGQLWLVNNNLLVIRIYETINETFYAVALTQTRQPMPVGIILPYVDTDKEPSKFVGTMDQFFQHIGITAPIETPIVAYKLKATVKPISPADKAIIMDVKSISASNYTDEQKATIDRCFKAHIECLKPHLDIAYIKHSEPYLVSGQKPDRTQARYHLLLSYLHFQRFDNATAEDAADLFFGEMENSTPERIDLCVRMFEKVQSAR